MTTSKYRNFEGVHSFNPLSKRDLEPSALADVGIHFELLQKPLFSVEDIAGRYEKISGARSAIKSLVRRGMVAKIRNNLYTCISGETGHPVANRFQIASAITSTSYVTHHSALEYYGITDQVFHDVYVASSKPFSEFDFDGYSFRYVHSSFLEGVETPLMSGNIRITNKERTLIDCINDMDRIGGMEEILACISVLKRVREEYLLKYLAVYNSQFLYQKVGYLLSKNQQLQGLSDNFFKFCREKIGKSKRYLSSDYKNGKYNKEWQLVIPKVVHSMKNGEM